MIKQMSLASVGTLSSVTFVFFKYNSVRLFKDLN